MRLRRIDIERSRLLRCGTTASMLRALTGSEPTSTPPTIARPPVGLTRVVSIPTVVVLPAPFGPSSPNTSPGATANVIPSTALTGDFGYLLTTPATSTAAARVRSVGTAPLLTEAQVNDGGHNA